MNAAWKRRGADASLGRVAERERLTTVFTLDAGDFSVFRTGNIWRVCRAVVLS